MTTLTLQNRDTIQIRPHVTRAVPQCYTPPSDDPISADSTHNDQFRPEDGSQAGSPRDRTTHRNKRRCWKLDGQAGRQGRPPSTARPHKGGHSGRRAYYILCVGGISVAITQAPTGKPTKHPVNIDEPQVTRVDVRHIMRRNYSHGRG